MDRSDKELLSLIINKDPEAYKNFYLRYCRLFYSLALSYTHDRNIADEISQIFWIAIWNNPAVIKTDVSNMAKGFLYKHFTFCIFDYLKSKVSRFDGATDEFWNNKSNELGYTHIIEDLETNELIDLINKTIEDLPQLIREVFICRWEKGLSTNETARELSMSEQTVRAKYNEALEKVRNQIQPLCTSKAYSTILFAIYLSMFK